MSDVPLTLGTAGHIDHGKTALVRALTGVDTDRLPQERARGLSIELGRVTPRLVDPPYGHSVNGIGGVLCGVAGQPSRRDGPPS